MTIEVIDAHHHLWNYSREEYPWIGEGMSALRRDFLPADLRAVLEETGVAGTIAVQARQTTAETEWLLELASSSDAIRGVVGWVPLIEPNVSSSLERLARNKKLKGVRHVLHDEADDFYMLRGDFNRGVSLLKHRNLRFDLLIFERHLPQAIEFVTRHPEQIFVLDHIAKPRIRERVIAPWRNQLAELARRENVYCKLSGMVTEADWSRWSMEDLRPYFDVVLEQFGPGRMLFGSDWPVVLVASSYKRWLESVRELICGLSEQEQTRILGGTAIEAYGL